VGEVPELVEISRIGGVRLSKFLLRQALTGHFVEVQRVLAFHNHQNADVALSVGPARERCARMGLRSLLGKETRDRLCCGFCVDIDTSTS
jgi:hypothetical protein